MLLEDFYSLVRIDTTEENKYEAIIRLNKDHDIFKGHFPGNPVTPGVCMIQILKEITSQIVDKKLSMKKSRNIKFLALINPEKNPELKLDIEVSTQDDLIKVKNTCFMEDTVALKMGIDYAIL